MKRVNITIKKDRILSAIDALTYKRVDGILSDQSAQTKNALSSDSEEGLDKSLLHHFMEGRDAALRARLAYCIVPEENESLDVSNDSLSNEDAFSFVLNAPDYFNRDVTKALVQKMHRYYVDGTAYDWYMRQGIEYSVSATELEDLISDIAASFRSPFVRRPLQPFGPVK